MSITPQRLAEAGEFIDRVTRWATRREDLAGLLLVGSYARGAARPDSDVDLVLLTTDPAHYFADAWAAELALGDPLRTRVWGPVTERRYALSSGLEVEFGIGTPDWARTDPVDPGTHRVVTDGARVLHDPLGILAALLARCRP
ncbi:nucleotidyltransferase domain-containing protein [Streptomyces misionensis]|uniref:Nucleotidyltransferase domain-containing protein n=1 Tax=Streptomyces misionensis TaxID=67331 RepID=A0A5C6ISM1_9ACTN|nr:nucleotidyltransferase domain-containing protein [Streptomyces misionensis]TWV31502.1 nucleotidyltransferase domain-containing protein [Streptomyces misionensis]